MATLPGRFSDGRAAASRKVLVTPSAAGLDIRGEDGLLVAFWHTADLRADGELPGGKGVRLRCAADSDARLSLAQAEFIRPLLPKRHRRPWRPVAAVLILGVGLAATLWLGFPAGARLLGAMIPAAWEQRWGDALADELGQRWGRCRQPAGEAALHLLADRLAAALPPTERPRRMVVLRHADAGALALPGGTVVVFSGLLAVSGDPGELAGELAHEFTHLRLRHPTAALLRAAGDATALAGAYSRDDEMVTDAGAQALLRQAGLDDAPALTPEQWAAVKGICG